MNCINKTRTEKKFQLLSDPTIVKNNCDEVANHIQLNPTHTEWIEISVMVVEQIEEL